MKNRIVVGLVGLMCAAATAQAGWEYTSVTKGEGGRHADMANANVHAFVDGAKARIEFTESKNPMMSAGNYLLTSDAGKTVYMVNPGEKTYSTWDLDAMMGMAGGMMGMMNMQVKDQKSEKLLEESGPKMQGLPTTHYKFHTAYTMEINFMGMKQSTTTVNEEELWSTTALKDDAFTFAAMRKGMKSGNAELDKLIAAQLNKAHGFPLKVVTKNTTKDARGQEHTSTMTMEVTELKQSSPAASQFKLPEGYTEQENNPMAALMGGGKKSGSGGKGGDNPLLKMLQEQMKKQQ
ncbi:MAG: DUF4412 domain-containing protein [Kiritimatiellaeota bacterium]|nr:DUF4412 domain-containing protein [Kiritimatiellota bacterium]